SLPSATAAFDFSTRTSSAIRRPALTAAATDRRVWVLGWSGRTFIRPRTALSWATWIEIRSLWRCKEVSTMMSSMTTTLCRLAVLVSLCFVVGCSRGYTGDPRYPLSGTVRVDGQPIDVGAISFIPAGADAQRVSGGPIAEGRYSVEEARGSNAG